MQAQIATPLVSIQAFVQSHMYKTLSSLPLDSFQLQEQTLLQVSSPWYPPSGWYNKWF